MILGRLPRPAALVAAGMTLTLGACRISFDVPRDPVSPPAVAAGLVATGRAERSLVVSLSVVRDGVESSVDGATLSASPASSVQFLGGGLVRLLEAGRVVLVATQAGAVDTLALDVRVPPTIVFDRLDAGVHHIYSAALDGRSLVPLTNGTSDDVRPTVGGGRVVYASFAAGQSDLRSVALSGGTSTAVTTTPSQFETEPALTPNGARLAFVRSELTDGLGKLFTAAGDGTGAQRAAPAFGSATSVDGAPRWNAAGDRVAFMSTTSGTPQLYVLTPSSGDVRALQAGSGPNVEPSFDAAGGTIAFSSARAGAPGIYTTDVAAGGAVWLARGTIGEPAWTADGRIVYTSYDGGTSELHWVDPTDLDNPHLIPTGLGSAAHPAVAP